jgi:5-methylcytosine-specific restriction endonuclease McrBC regulatory subunit McrC
MNIYEEIDKVRSIMYEGISNEDESFLKYLKGEIDEIQRVVQYLNREENIDIGFDELFSKFLDSDEQKLTKNIWNKLENTESNTDECKTLKNVRDIADKYNKTSPDKLSKSLLDGSYNRPLIVKFNDRYHLVAGNTRLCTASAIGMNPMVHIVQVS